MCLILDVNIIPQVFPVPSGDFEPVFEAVTSGHVKLVYGGKLTREYERIGWFRKLLVILDRQGSAVQVSCSMVDDETETVTSCGHCVSDDQHIVALARIGKARLLCSNDDALTTDFRNPVLISKPRGKVYKRREHANLLRIKCGYCH